MDSYRNLYEVTDHNKIGILKNVYKFILKDIKNVIKIQNQSIKFKNCDLFP